MEERTLTIIDMVNSSYSPAKTTVPVTYSINASHANTTTEVFPEVEIPSITKVILIILYTFTTLAALLGNSLVIIVFTKGKRSNTEVCQFLINLAVADLIMAIFCIPFTFAYEVTGDWMFPKAMCPIVQSCQLISVMASVSTNTAIGIDRLIAVKYPLRKRFTTSRTKLVILCIWVLALSLGIVPILKTETQEIGGKWKCIEIWPNGDHELIYGLFIMIITYFLPVTILSVTYITIGRELWRRNLPGNADDTRDANQLRSKRKVVKMLATIVLLFGICWFPLHLFILVHTFMSNLNVQIYFAVHWLSMANSFVNPVIYGFMNDNFRADLRSLAQMWCCWYRRKSKYRTAAIGWRLGDSNGIEAPDYFRSRSLGAGRGQLHSSDNPKTRRSPGWNRHASDPGIRRHTSAGCDRKFTSNKNNQMVAKQNIKNGLTNSEDDRRNRNIFVSDKRRTYEPNNHRISKQSIVNGENNVLLGECSSERSDASIQLGENAISVSYKGEDKVVLNDGQKLNEGHRDDSC